MKETKPHKWSQAIYYVLASIVFLVLILAVAEMFFPSTSPELDPQAYYGYRFSIDDARRGFRLAGQNFKLISARESAIRIWHIKK